MKRKEKKEIFKTYTNEISLYKFDLPQKYRKNLPLGILWKSFAVKI